MLSYEVHFKTVADNEEIEFLVHVDIEIQEFLAINELSYEDLIYNKALQIVNSSEIYKTGGVLHPIDIINLEHKVAYLH